MLELPQALDCVTQAFKEAGISLNPTDLYAHDLPESPMELFSRIEESRQITADFLPEDEVAMQLTHLMHYAGPTREFLICRVERWFLTLITSHTAR